MIGTGTIVNVLAIIAGGLLGLLAKGRRKLRGQDGVIHALGLAPCLSAPGMPCAECWPSPKAP